MRSVRSNTVFALTSIASIAGLICAVTLLGDAVRWSVLGVIGVSYAAVIILSLAHGRRAARQFVVGYLASSRAGFALENSVLAQGEREGFSERSLRRAMDELDHQTGRGTWALAMLAVVAPEAHFAAMQELTHPAVGAEAAAPVTALAATEAFPHVRARAPFFGGEGMRVHELRSLELMGSAAEPAYDELVATARALFQTPIVAINFIDRNTQWTKAGYGLTAQECSRDDSFCSHTMAAPTGTLIVNDARRDRRFATMNPVVGGPLVRSYAGATIYGPSGAPIGAICIADDATDSFHDRDLGSLYELAGQATTLVARRALELR